MRSSSDIPLDSAPATPQIPVAPRLHDKGLGRVALVAGNTGGVKIALLRIGVDTGTGGIHGPLFQDRSFEYIPIPDRFGLDHRTYGNVVGRHGHPLASYFPFSRRAAIARRSVHLDPEFET